MELSICALLLNFHLSLPLPLQMDENPRVLPINRLNHSFNSHVSWTVNLISDKFLALGDQKNWKNLEKQFRLIIQYKCNFLGEIAKLLKPLNWFFFKTLVMNQGFIIYVVVFYKALVHTWEIELHSLARVNEPSTGCPLWCTCGWTSTELISSFTSITHTIRSRSYIWVV